MRSAPDVESDPSPDSGFAIRRHRGPREELRELFELAEDSAMQLEQYMPWGDVFVAVGSDGIVGHIQLVSHGESGIEIKNMAVLPSRQGRGLGRELVEAAADFARQKKCSLMVVGTATADIGNLRFYQRLGFRMARIERDAFTRANGYPTAIDLDGIRLRDRVWLERTI